MGAALMNGISDLKKKIPKSSLGCYPISEMRKLRLRS